MFFSMLLVVLSMLVVMTIFGAISPRSPLVDVDSPLNMALFRAPQQSYTDQLVNVWVEKTWIHTGQRIPCRLEKYKASNDTPYLIIYSHGGTENLLSCTPFMREASRALQTDILSWEYSGFGLNNAEKYERSAEGVNLTLRTVVSYALDTLGYKQIILWGSALGVGPTLAIASEGISSVRGVICFASFTSVLEVVRDWTHQKVADMFEERWDNRTAISKVMCPILLLHGKNDSTIHANHSEELKRAQPNADLVLLAKTTHTSFDWAEVLHHVARWRTEVRL